MRSKKVETYPLGGWLALAMSAPFAYLAGRQSWLTLLVTEIVCMAAFGLVLLRPTHKLLSYPIFCLVEYIFLIAVCTATAVLSSGAWPTGRGYPIVPLTLIVLATVSAYWGADRASKGMGVLFWLTIILYSVLLCFGLKNIQLQNLRPRLETPYPIAWFVLLLPCVIQFIPQSHKKKGQYGYSLLGAVAVAFAVWTEGNLSLQSAKGSAWPFYEAGESVHLLGVANRLEALISVGATVGYYGLYSLLVSAGGHLAERCKPGWGNKGTIILGALGAAGVLFQIQISHFVLAVSAFVLWVALPILVSIFPSKKCKKEQNNA